MDLSPSQDLSEKGSVILWILIAVALFAALGFAFSQSQRTSGGFITQESANALAHEAQDYANTVNTAVKRLRLRGCAANEISYETPLGNNGNLAAPADESCHVFRINGGQVQFKGTDTPFKRVFVTSTAQDGDMGGLTGADGICNARALAAGIGSVYLAWLSDDTGTPDSRFVKATDDYVLVDNTVVANGWTDLTDGDIDNAINLDENGNVTPHSLVWSNTNVDGTIILGTRDCTEWTGGGSGSWGNPTITSAAWTVGAIHPCSNTYPIYCFEQ